MSAPAAVHEVVRRRAESPVPFRLGPRSRVAGSLTSRRSAGIPRAILLRATGDSARPHALDRYLATPGRRHRRAGPPRRLDALRGGPAPPAGDYRHARAWPARVPA